MKPRIETTITCSFIAIAIVPAMSHGTVMSGQNESCTTIRPGPDWTCRNGGWLPPGYPTQDGPAPERRLEGVWLVTITPRNCATGDPVPTAAFEALYTFHNDSTMLVSFRNNSLTLERTAAHGLWRRDGSNHSFKFVHLRRNVSTGAFAGKQEGEGTLVLSDSGDEFTTDGSSAGFDANGNPAAYKLFDLRRDTVPVRIVNAQVGRPRGKSRPCAASCLREGAVILDHRPWIRIDRSSDQSVNRSLIDRLPYGVLRVATNDPLMWRFDQNLPANRGDALWPCSGSPMDST